MAANCNIPDDVLRKYNEASSFLIPTKSSERYGKEYKQFCEWKRENGVSEINEKIMLAYLFDLSKIRGGESFVQVLTEKSKEIIATSASSSSTFHDVIPRLEIIGNTDCTINVNVKV